MGHVDDAHHAEGNRQADGDQHEHRSNAQAEEQCLDACIERARAIDPAHGRGGGLPDLLVRLDEIAVRPFFEHAGKAVPHLRPEPAGERRDGIQARPGLAAVERGERKPGLYLFLDRRIRFDAGPPAEQRDARLIEVAQHLLNGRQLHGRVRTREIKARNRRFQQLSQAVVRADPGELVVRAGAGVLQRCRIDQVDRRQGVVRRFDDEDLVVLRARVEAILEEGSEHRPRARMTAPAQTLDDVFLVEEAGVAQLPEHGEKLLVPRLRERMRREHNQGEQQRRQPQRPVRPCSSTGPLGPIEEPPPLYL